MRFCPDLSFGTQFIISSLCLTVCFYVLARSAAFPSLKEVALCRKFPLCREIPSVHQSQLLQGYPLCRLRLPVMPMPRLPHVFWRMGLALRTSHDCCRCFNGCIQSPVGLTTKLGHGCCLLGQGWSSCSWLWGPVVIFGSTDEQA